MKRTVSLFLIFSTMAGWISILAMYNTRNELSSGRFGSQLVREGKNQRPSIERRRETPKWKKALFRCIKCG